MKLDAKRISIIEQGFDLYDAWASEQGEELTDELIDELGKILKPKIPFSSVLWPIFRRALDYALPDLLTFVLRRVLQSKGLYPSDRRLEWPGGR